MEAASESAAPQSAAPENTTPPPEDKTTPKPRRDGWSLSKQTAFLRALSATHSVTDAARSVQMTRQSAYRLRSKLKGQPFDLAWEVAFHHSYDVLAHAALDRALNGVERPVFFQGEQIGSYRRFDERLTVALLGRQTMGDNPNIGRLGPVAERQARDFEALLGKVEAGEAVETGALDPEDPGEIEYLQSGYTSIPRKEENPYHGRFDEEEEGENDYDPSCPSTWSDDKLIQALEEVERERRK